MLDARLFLPQTLYLIPLISPFRRLTNPQKHTQIPITAMDNKPESTNGSTGDFNTATLSEKQMQEKEKRGFQFWMCFASLILPTFLVALDIVSVHFRFA